MPVDPAPAAILDARAVGGPLEVPELERIWDAAPPNGSVLLVDGCELELEQIEILLRRKRVVTITRRKSSAEPERRSVADYRLIIVLAADGAWGAAADARRRFPKTPLIEIDARGRPPTRYAKRAPPAATPVPEVSSSLKVKLSNGMPLRMTIINDVGFRYGAGVALRRQTSSFLLNGWHVSIAALSPGEDFAKPSATGLEFEHWRGVQNIGHIHAESKLSDTEIVAELTSVVRATNPDVVLVENIHGAGWPIDVLPAIQKLGAVTLAYMHDCYWVTGRCAHAGPCDMFLTGCNETCPTAHLYPRLAPEKIAGAWRAREVIFTGPNAIPLIANSRWTRDFVKKRFNDRACDRIVHLGLDHYLFSPIPKDSARRLLGLPGDKTVIVMGAVNMHDPYKAGPLFRALHQALIEREDVALVLFGYESEKLACAKAFGHVADERLMPFIYSAGDIFVNTATAESFGQTLLEAHACGVPAVALDVGGVSDIVVDGETGYLVARQEPGELVAAVEKLIADPVAQRRMGDAGRARVTHYFTLEHQATAWIECLKSLC